MSVPRPTPVLLKRIRVYPLKGAGGCDLTETGLDAFGIPGDRRWMLVRPDGSFVSQRTHPRLALVRVKSGGRIPPGGEEKAGEGPSTRQGMGGSWYSVEIPGADPFFLEVPDTHDWVEARVHKDRVSVLGGFQAEDRLFSEFLGEECRLVFLPAEVLRPVDPKWAPGHRVSLADGYPFHLVSEESLADLNGILKTPVSILRFRPNLVVGGGEAWEEDLWRTLRIGEMELDLVKPCARCTVVTVDQETGARGGEPLNTLKGVRGWEGKVFFGQNAVFHGSGSFRVGDGVHILKKGVPHPPLALEAEA